MYSTSQIPTIDEVFDPNGDVVELTNKCGIDTACSIVAGSNAITPIRTTINRINTDRSNLQDDFEAAAQDTTNPDYDEVFSPFPEGDIETNPRDPLIVCRDAGLCPSADSN